VPAIRFHFLKQENSLKEKVMTETNPTEEAYDDEIDLRSIFAVLWKRRRLIIFGTLGATLLSIGISLILSKVYRSEGFFQLGNPTKKVAENEKSTTKKTAPIVKKTTPIGVPVPLYKSSSSQFFNPNRFQLIVSQDKSFGEEEIKKIKNNFRTAEDIHKWIKPVYAFAKEDTREFAQLPQDESNAVIGLNLSYEADSPEQAYTYVGFFGNYIRDCLLYVTLYNYIMDGYSNTVSQMDKKENDIINLKFELLQNNNKLIDIRAILSNYPESAKIENRQLVSIQEGGDRFLAPVTQLVGIESALADLRRDLAELERDKEKMAVRSEYFSNCYRELAKIGEKGESLLLLLKTMKDEVFKNKDLSKDEVKEVFNNLSIDLQTFDFIFYQNTRFISGPTIPTGHFKPRKSLIVIATFIGSFFFFLVLAFIVHWWQANKKAIMSDSSA
jgi:LPS O-antigen subunit length determinant protein (WzzB/FepE family)